MKTYEIMTTNTAYLVIEAISEQEAITKLEKEIDEDYYYPIDNADSCDGWEVRDVYEVEE
tara:strand:- start:1794 stop:1973 length:180 start_codon:yes stop_codon:yes gene_type:complete